MLSAQRHHELLVGFLLARLVQHAHVRLSSIERLGGFAEAPGETVVDEGEFEGAFEGFEGGLPGFQISIVFMTSLWCSGSSGGGWRDARGRVDFL